MNQRDETDFLVETTVRLTILKTDGSCSMGTGFFYAKELDNRAIKYFLVTNKHVLENAQSVHFVMFNSKQDNNGYDIANYADVQNINISAEQLAKFSCCHHSDDVDIQIILMNTILSPYAIENGRYKLIIRPLSKGLIPTAKQIKMFFSFENIVFIGYPDGQWDEVNHLPIIRTGTTASLLSQDFNGKPQFLIDASVFPGSSGSPVFIANGGSFSAREGMVYGTRLLFLGVIARVFQIHDEGDIISVPAPTNINYKAQYKQMIDLGIVMKAHTVEETVDMFLEKNSDKFE